MQHRLFFRIVFLVLLFQHCYTTVAATLESLYCQKVLLFCLPISFFPLVSFDSSLLQGSCSRLLSHLSKLTRKKRSEQKKVRLFNNKRTLLLLFFYLLMLFLLQGSQDRYRFNLGNQGYKLKKESCVSAFIKSLNACSQTIRISFVNPYYYVISCLFTRYFSGFNITAQYNFFEKKLKI